MLNISTNSEAGKPTGGVGSGKSSFILNVQYFVALTTENSTVSESKELPDSFSRFEKVSS